MPKGIQFDEAGNMAAVHIGADSIMSHLYEHIGCKVVTPIEIHAGVVLWLDAEGPDNGQRFNGPLTELGAVLGLDIDGKFGIYGPGVFLGGTATAPASLSPEDRLNIVLKQLRTLTHSN